ncbi:proteasome-activating nucleotidase [Thermoplasmatales archaeon SW_10_69_26]|jgi:proteasome regulatory subunit|nr:MAG: proteasome-activating nucleotidase [Thermoplasmatales archaeon SW_10_69_26]
MSDDLDLDPSDWDDYSEYLAERLENLEERNTQLRDQKREIEAEYRESVNDRKRLEREVKHLRSEMEKLKAPPLVVGFVKDVLEDGRVVCKSSAGPNFVARIAEFVDGDDLEPGDRVGLNQQTMSVVAELPPSLDPNIYGAEVLEEPEVNYGDIGGLDQQLEELREAVELPLSRPEAFDEVGITPPKGILLHGPPGTGKTLMAKAVAAQTNAVFIRIVGSELVQKYIGEGARLVRELFQMARDKAPCVVFIDELDAIGASRYQASTSGDREVQRTLMQLLSELDGFDNRGDVKIIGATNRVDMLDSALTRPGRFDRRLEVPEPDVEGRSEIFQVHTRGMEVAEELEARDLALLVGEGATGADIHAICTEAGMRAIRSDRTVVNREDFEHAADKVKGQAIDTGEQLTKDAAFA